MEERQFRLVDATSLSASQGPGARVSSAARRVAPRRASPQVQICGFGNPEILVQGRDLGPNLGPHARALLCFLLLVPGRRAVSHELAARLWPSLDAESASHCLDAAVRGLRRQFALRGCADLALRDQETCLLNPAVPIAFDIGLYEELAAAGDRLVAQRAPGRAARAYEQAVSLYRGEVFAPLPPAPWLDAVRERFRQRNARLLETLGEHFAGTGAVNKAAGYWHALLEIDPCREIAHRGLMRCYAVRNQTILALQQYSIARTVLEVEQGRAPDACTTALYELIKRGRWARTAPEAGSQ